MRSIKLNYEFWKKTQTKQTEEKQNKIKDFCLSSLIGAFSNIWLLGTLNTAFYKAKKIEYEEKLDLKYF